ncbi:hypothetical protein GCM10027442_46970 [Emticicia fontis]
MADKFDTWVYIHRKNMDAPKSMAILSAQQAKGRKAFSFLYTKNRFQKCWGRRKKSNIPQITLNRINHTW